MDNKKLEEAARKYGRMVAAGSGSFDVGNAALDAFLAGAGWQADQEKNNTYNCGSEQAWLARDEDGGLYLFMGTDEVIKNKTGGLWYSDGSSMQIEGVRADWRFQYVKWEDENPTPVTIEHKFGLQEG